MNDYYMVEPCTSASGFEIKLKKRGFDLKKAERALDRGGGNVIACTPVLLVVGFMGCSISLYASGRAMIKSEKKLSRKRADEVASAFMRILEKGGAVVKI